MAEHEKVFTFRLALLSFVAQKTPEMNENFAVGQSRWKIGKVLVA